MRICGKKWLFMILLVRKGLNRLQKFKVGLMEVRITRIFTGLVRIIESKIRINLVKIRKIRTPINPTLFLPSTKI